MSEGKRSDAGECTGVSLGKGGGGSFFVLMCLMCCVTEAVRFPTITQKLKTISEISIKQYC